MAELVEVDVPYALEMKVVTRAQVPVLGRRTIETLSYSQVRFAKSDTGAWTQTVTPCAMRNDSGRVEFPAAFVAAIPPRTHDIVWTGSSYHVDTLPAFLSVTPADGPLPTDPADPRVLDADGDGHPGVTIHLGLPIFGKVRLYLVQVNHNVMDGELSEGVIRGKVTIERLETRTIGASVGMFAMNPEVEVVAGASTFSIVRDPGETCAGAFVGVDP